MGSTTLKRECLVNADGHGIASFLNVVDSGSLLAWEVAPSFVERGVVERRAAVRHGCVHDHVSIGSVGEGHGGGHEDGFR